MNLPSRNKQERTRFDGETAISIKEETVAANDKVNFISCMWLLRVAADRRVKLHDQRAMRENGNSEIPGWWWTFGQCFCEPNMNNSCCGFHAPTPACATVGLCSISKQKAQLTVAPRRHPSLSRIQPAEAPALKSSHSAS